MFPALWIYIAASRRNDQLSRHWKLHVRCRTGTEFTFHRQRPRVDLRQPASNRQPEAKALLLVRFAIKLHERPDFGDLIR